MSIIINGTDAVIAQPLEINYDSSRGYFVKARARGSKAKVQALIPGYIDAGYNIQCSSLTGAVWQIIGTSPTPTDGSAEPVINIWESIGGVVAKDLLNADIADSIAETDKTRIRNAIANPTADGSEPTSPALAGLALTVFRLMKKGEVSKEIYTTNVRLSQIVSNKYGTVNANTNIGAIFSSLAVGFPADFLAALPASGSSPRALVNGAGTGYYFGYKKKAANVTTEAYSKRRVVLEWEFGEWNRVTHPVFVTAGSGDPAP